MLRSPAGHQLQCVSVNAAIQDPGFVIDFSTVSAAVRAQVVGTFMARTSQWIGMRLNDVRILDLSRLLPGPYATQLLADLGADVIKIEDPDIGDYARHLDGTETPSGVSPTFDVVNRGKRAMTLNLKTREGREVFYRLVEDADVVFEQFRPGVVDRLGVDYDTVREYNPGLVYCSLSGFGQAGPYEQRVGHDLNYIGYAGLLDMTRPGPDAAPTLPGYPIADMVGGAFAAFSIVSALLDRELGSGTGEYIDVAMTDAVLSLSQPIAAAAMLGGEPRPGETRLTGKFACYNVYETADGRYVTLAALEPKFWEAFCRAVGLERHIDDHLAEDPDTRAEVKAAVAAVFRDKPWAEWEDELGGRDVMFGLVKSVSESLEDPQIRSRGIIEDHEDILSRVRFPAVTRSGFERIEGAVAEKGEHTVELLRDHGYSQDAIDALREDGAI